jgi:hypothetical protein
MRTAAKLMSDGARRAAFQREVPSGKNDGIANDVGHQWLMSMDVVCTG